MRPCRRRVSMRGRPLRVSRRGARARRPGEVPERPRRRAVARGHDGADRRSPMDSMPPPSPGHPPRRSAAARGLRSRGDPGVRVAASCGPVPARLLDRRPGPPQTGLAAAARRAGPHFVARRAAPLRVLLVDDVATTGATLAAAASGVAVRGRATSWPSRLHAHRLRDLRDIRVPILRVSTRTVADTDARCTWTSWFEGRTARCRPGSKLHPRESREDRALHARRGPRRGRLLRGAHRANIDARQLCEITVHLKRHFVKAHAAAAEPEAALDLAIDKAEHQVARIKEKRVARSHPRHGNGRSGNGAVSDDAIPKTTTRTRRETLGRES